MELVMTDAFTKYVEAIAISDKQAETVAVETLFTGFVNLDHQCKFTQAMEQNL